MPGGFGLLLLVAFVLVMWLVLIRPQQRRQRELAGLQASLEVGDEVMLTSGVYGVVRGLEAQTVRIEVADGVVLRVARPAVGRLVAPEEDPTSQAAADDTDDTTPEHDLPEPGSTGDDDVSEET